jgi:uncharacterized protein
MDETQFKGLIQESPFEESPVMPNMLEGDRVIQFRCHRGVKCWNACCSNIDITLTPYDILRLKNRLGISSGEFLQKYTVPFEMDKDGMPGVKLRAVEGGTACQFMVPEGCSVYQDRPTACRYYPVALMSLRRQDEFVDRQAYALVQEPHCLGHLEDQHQTIDQFRQDQGVVEYDEKGRGWRQLVLKRKSAGPAVGTPTPLSNQLFFMASYDLDRFRAFVMSDGFNQTYEVPVDTMAEIVADDEKLMEFGIGFLKQVLFNEPFLQQREGAYEARLAKRKERMDQINAELQQAKLRAEDDKYDSLKEGDGGKD